MDYPKQYRYTQEHEWVELNGASAKIGITDYAQQQLGDVVFVEMPAVGATLQPGQAFGTVESVKAVSEVFAPMAGTVAAINEELGKKPELINSDPHAAWLITATVTDPKAITSLMDADAYQRFIATQEASH